MLELAIRHKDALSIEKAEACAVGRSDYYDSSGWSRYSCDVEESDWNSIQMVSVHESRLIGYFSADISRVMHTVSGLATIRFSGNKRVFLEDLAGFIKLLHKKGFLSILFNVIEENTEAKSLCDKFISRVGDACTARSIGYITHGAKINGNIKKKFMYEVMLSDKLIERMDQMVKEIKRK